MLRAFPKTALRKPPESFEVSRIREEGYKHKDDLNNVLNHARAYEPKGYLDKDDANTKWLQENIEDIASRMSLQLKTRFKYHITKKEALI